MSPPLGHWASGTLSSGGDTFDGFFGVGPSPRSSRSIPQPRCWLTTPLSIKVADGFLSNRRAGVVLFAPAPRGSSIVVSHDDLEMIARDVCFDKSGSRITRSTAAWSVNRQPPRPELAV